MRRRAAAGFTLLEVVIALAILGVALMAIFDLNAGAVAMHGYTKRLTVASLLARSKMTDVEQELLDKGFQLDDQEMSGDFSEEGWESFKWRARIIAPRTSGVTPQQVMGAIFNLPMGGEGEGGQDPLGALGAMLGGGAAGGQGGQTTGGIAGMVGGLAAPMMQQQFTQMLDQISKQVREVHVTVTWKDGTQTESMDVVTHVVSPGAGGGTQLPPSPQLPGGGAGK